MCCCRKWWASGACDPRCSVAIFMGKTDPGAPAHSQQSMILVPMGGGAAGSAGAVGAGRAPTAPAGLTVVRPLPVFGFDDAPHGHAELVFEEVVVPTDNIILGG